MEKDKADASSIVENLLSLAPHMEIVHHIPGRIRLKILLSGLLLAQKMDIDAMLGRFPGVRSIRVNPAARSVVIEYDEKQLPVELWQSLDQLKRRPELAEDLRGRLLALLG